jgi:hypothetical protein
MAGSKHAGNAVWCACLIVGALLLPSVGRADRIVEDVRVSRQGSMAQVAVILGCPMRYVDHAPSSGGTELRIRLAPLPECRQMGVIGGIAAEMTRPAGRDMARVEEIEFETTGFGDSFLVLRFFRPISFQVRQRGDLRTVEIEVATEVVPPPLPVAIEPALQPQPATPTTRVVPRNDRPPLRLRPQTGSGNNKPFVINLKSTEATPTGPPALPLKVADLFPDKKLFLSDAFIGKQRWHRLRLGFFDSETAAREAMAQLKPDFPQAWVGRAAPAEPLQTPSTDQAAAAQTAVAIPAPPTKTTSALADERLASLMAEAKQALLDNQDDQAIKIYTRVLEEPGHEYRPEAREFLGVAREHKGQLAHAKAQYQAYLQEFPETPDSKRVARRLQGLVSATEAPRDKLRMVDSSSADWDVYGGLSQYYRRDVNQFQEDAPEIVSQSAIFTDADLLVRRRGERIDLLARVTAGYSYDMLNQPRAPGNQSRTSYAYIDVTDQKYDLNGRLGRQSRNRGGILGRFDGLHLGYEVKPDLLLNFTTGYPVDSSREGTSTERSFYGIGVEWLGLRDTWDLGAFYNAGEIAGIKDRESIGGEVRYIDPKRHMIAMVDFDISYNELNSALVLGTWRFENLISVNVLFDTRQSPILTTRNALIGQPVVTMDELLLRFTEDEIRQFAQDRTSQTETVTLGISRPLFDRFQINTDITVTETSATVPSGNVPELPASGSQIFFSTSLIGSSLFMDSDVNVLGLRYSSTRSSDTTLLTLDGRYPLRRGLRLNPRLRVSLRDNKLGGSEEWIAAPSFRMILRWKRHYRLEFEMGGLWSTRKLDPIMNPLAVDTTEDTSGYFVNLGYRADF